MPHHPSAFGVTDNYNDFLFAPISEQENGMQLSVLSALARANVDPWEEAARLATMSPADAEWALVATLSKVPGRTWSLSDAEVIAKRLIQRLPQAAYPAPNVQTEPKRNGARLINYWLMWLGFFIALSLSQQRNHQTTATLSVETSNKGASGLLKNDGENRTSSQSNGSIRGITSSSR